MADVRPTGAWSTAKDLYEKRDAARERRAANAGGSSMAKGLEWNPKGRKPAERIAPSLVNICLDFLQVTFFLGRR